MRKTVEMRKRLRVGCGGVGELMKGQDVETPVLATANSHACYRSCPHVVSPIAVHGCMEFCLVLEPSYLLF